MERKNLVIIGSGAAGLGAAVAAAEKGVKDIVVLEKAKNIGGISITGMGIFAIESKYQKEKNVNYTKDQAFHDLMEITQWKPDAKLVREYVNKSGDTIDWLEEKGVKFQLLDKLTYPGAINQTGHLIVHPTLGTRPGCTSEMINCLLKRAQEYGVEVITEAAVTGIEKSENGYVIFYKKDDEPIMLDTKAAVIASGGCVHDPEMLHDIGKPYGHDYVYNKSYGLGNNIPLTGELIKMAWSLGCVPDGMALMGTTYMDGFKFPRSPETQPLWDFMSFSFPYLWVNKDGERFVDEGNMNGAYMSNAVARQKDGQYFLVFDQALIEHIKNDGPDIYGYLLDDDNVDLEKIFKIVMERSDNYFMADTLDELAEKMNIPADRFKATIEEYNYFCEDRHDAVFAKNPKFLKPISTPKYYAIRRMNAGYGTVGGIKINHKAETIDKDINIIPGLYAAGDCANGIVSYNTSIMYYVWGGTLGFAINSGRIAGENAADYILK